MFIQRIVIRRLRALRDIDHSFTLWNGQRSQLTCLKGLNGSGKTTYLEAIAALWDLFRTWAETRKHAAPHRDSLLRDAELCAMNIVDLPGPAPSLWLVWGRRSTWEQLREREPGLAIGVLFTDRAGRPGLLQDDDEEPLRQAVYSFFGDAYKKLQRPGISGGESLQLLPNMVVLGAEERYLQPLRGDLTELAVEPAFEWLFRYTPTERKQGHLENQMVELRDVDPARYQHIGREIRRVLPRIDLLERLEGHRRRPLVRVRGVERPLTIDMLSAGERTTFLVLFLLYRWLGEGGVVLIDEPELHQHLSLMLQNLAFLENIVGDQKHGQLFVASHVPEVWDQCRGGKVIELPRAED